MFDQNKVELLSYWGTDRSVAEAAWASSSDKSALSKKTEADVERVVKSVVELGHASPKERIWFEFFITCTIATERQLDKYRMTTQVQDIQVTSEVGAFGRYGISQNELSGRYRTIPARPYGLPGDVALVIATARNGHRRNPRWETDDYEAKEIQEEFDYKMLQQHEYYQSQLARLKEAEKEGTITNAEYKRAREVLRGHLGTAFLTDMRLVMNLNALEHILNQRLAADTQLETRYVALLMLKAVQAAGVAPTTIAEMVKTNGWQALVNDIEAKVTLSDSVI